MPNDPSEAVQVVLGISGPVEANAPELAEIQELARRRRQTTAAWVREALRRAREETVYPDTVRKLKGVREATAHAYPIADLGPMLDEIERGYLDGDRS